MTSLENHSIIHGIIGLNDFKDYTSTTHVGFPECFQACAPEATGGVPKVPKLVEFRQGLGTNKVPFWQLLPRNADFFLQDSNDSVTSHCDHPSPNLDFSRLAPI